MFHLSFEVKERVAHVRMASLHREAFCFRVFLTLSGQKGSMMAIRLRNLPFKRLFLTGGVALIISTGIFLSLVPTKTPIASTSYLRTVRAAQSTVPASASSTASPRPSSSPVVAGAAASAPHQNPPLSQATQAPASTPVPTPWPQVTLDLTIGAASSSYPLRLLSGANACTILYEAKNEGKITSVTISDQYVSSLGSLYVEEINGFQNWNYSVNGGKSPPWGCSNPKAPQINAGDTIHWVKS
jgi:hypothetical protein